MEQQIQAILHLHNVLRTKSSESYTPVGFNDTETNNGTIVGMWGEGSAPNLASSEDMQYERTSFASKDVRKKLCQDLSE